MGQHGPQCICEICTCGRHSCPFDRSKTNTALSFGNDSEGHYYRKEFATVENGGERAKATRPKGELALNNAVNKRGRGKGKWSKLAKGHFEGSLHNMFILIIMMKDWLLWGRILGEMHQPKYKIIPSSFEAIFRWP